MNHSVAALFGSIAAEVTVIFKTLPIGLSHRHQRYFFGFSAKKRPTAGQTLEREMAGAC